MSGILSVGRTGGGLMPAGCRQFPVLYINGISLADQEKILRANTAALNERRPA